MTQKNKPFNQTVKVNYVIFNSTMKPSIELSRKWVDCSTISIVDSGEYGQQPDVFVLECKMYSKSQTYYIVMNSALDIANIISEKKQWVINSNTLGVTPLTSNLLQFELGIFEIKVYSLYSRNTTFQLQAGVTAYSSSITLPEIIISGNRVFKVTKEATMWRLDKEPLITTQVQLYNIEQDVLYVPSLCQFERTVTTSNDCDYSKTARNFALIQSIEYLITCGKLQEALECIKTLEVEDCGCLDVVLDDNNDCGCS